MMLRDEMEHGSHIDFAMHRLEWAKIEIYWNLTRSR